MAFPHLNLLTIFSLIAFPFFFVKELFLQTTTAAEINHGVGSAEKILERIIHGQKLSNRPSILLFTAPYRLCEGGCNDTDNFAMAFPLYVGTRGMQQYKKIYGRDFKNLHSFKPHAPFKQKTTRHPFTLCPTTITTTTTTAATTTTKPVTFTVTEPPPTTPIKLTEKELLIYSGSETSTANYVTNAKGVRCPMPIRAFCKKKSRNKVTPEIVTLNVYSDNFNQPNSKSFDYYIHARRRFQNNASQIF